MNKLIKNELIKLSHRPGLYVFYIVFLLLTISTTFLTVELNKTMNDVYMEKPDKEDYDLENEDELNDYLDMMTQYKLMKISENYSYTSAKYYYINTELYDTVYCIESKDYKEIDEDEYNECKSNYELTVKNLKNFDWKKELKNKKADLKEEILNLDEDDDNYEADKEYLNNEIKVINYRLNNNYYPSYSEDSLELDAYPEIVENYKKWDKNDKKYTSTELEKKKDDYERYYIAKHKMKNKLFTSDEEKNTKEITISSFNTIDFYTIIAIMIIAGGIISEEFTKGTIKQLLIRPYSRSKILVSKILSVIILAFISLLLIALTRIIISLIAYGGWEQIKNGVYIFDYDRLQVLPIGTFKYCFINLLGILPEYLMIILGMILVGIISSNTSLVTTTGFILYLLPIIFSGFTQYKIVNYLPFITCDLTKYIYSGIDDIKYIPLTTSIIIDIVTIFILLFACIFIFHKKDIKN